MFRQAGSKCTVGREIDLFDGYLWTNCKNDLRGVLSGVLTIKTDKLIFNCLQNAYPIHADETIFIASEIACRHGIDESVQKTITDGTFTVSAYDEVEYILLKVALRVALMVINHKTGDCATDFYVLHQMLRVIQPNSRVRVYSGKRPEEMPDYANFFTFDAFQETNLPPPMGLIPNNGYLCYAASALTIILSIPSLVQKIYEVNKRKSSPFLGILTYYAHFLQTSCYSQKSMEELNEDLMKLDIFSEFEMGKAGDSIDFLNTILDGLEKYDIDHCVGTCDIPSLLDSERREVDAQDPKTEIIFDYTLSEDADMESWTINYLEKPETFFPFSVPIPAFEEIYRDRKGSWCGTLDEIVNRSTTDEPEILIIKHCFSMSEIPCKMGIPIHLKIGSSKYCLHGVSLHDCNFTDGHYISAIISNTSMFFYDPQYDPNSELPIVYRARFICYLKIK